MDCSTGVGLEVFPTNVDAMRVFLCCATQWETPGMGGGRYTVPLTEVEAALRLVGVRRPRDVFRQVHVMISAARTVLIEQDADARKRAAKEARERG